MAKTIGHSYTVELRVFGRRLDPDALTREVGLQPCNTWRIGDRIGDRVRVESMWAFDGAHGPWPSLEEGLVFVLNRTEPLADRFRQYAVEHTVLWWCGHFQNCFDGGPRLSAAVLRRLAIFGAELFIDNYFSQAS